MLSYNLPDPTEQERVRRGSHEYVSDGGVHGRYKPKIYIRQEYPKIMDRTPYPQLKDFAGKHDAEILLEHARKMWDTRQMSSIVNTAIEEQDWLVAHADDPVLTPGAYPKTMDRTPAPRSDECAGLEDYRARRLAWREQIANSIVHDEVEEQLWLEEHKAAEAPKRTRDAGSAYVLDQSSPLTPTGMAAEAPKPRRGRPRKAAAA